MEPYKVETTMTDDGVLTLQGLPFMAGEAVEVIVVPLPAAKSPQDNDPLRGHVVKYDEPYEPVASDDWEAAR